MFRKIMVGALGAIATDFLTDNPSVKAQIDKMVPAGSKGNAVYAAINGVGAVVALKYFGGGA